MIRFGPAGIPIQCQGNSTLDGVKCCADLGLAAMEMEFVHGVRMKEDSAKEISQTAKDLDISLSSHAPYYVNCCTEEKKKMAKIVSFWGIDVSNKTNRQFVLKEKFFLA